MERLERFESFEQPKSFKHVSGVRNEANVFSGFTVRQAAWFCRHSILE